MAMLTKNPATPHSLTEQAAALTQGFPALLAEAERVADIVASGVHGRRRAGVGESFWQYRPYQNTDAAARIDWRRSARGEQLYVRDNEWEASNWVYLWADIRASMMWRSDPKLPYKSERGQLLTLACANLLMRAGEHCALMDSPQLRARTGRVGYERLAQELINQNVAKHGHEANEAEENLPLNRDFKAHSKAVLISDFLDPSELWQSRLARLSAQSVGGILVQIIDPAEAEFPFKGRLEMRAAESPLKKLLLGRAEAQRDAYIAQWDAHNKRLSELAAGLGWDLIPHRTDQPASNALLQLYQSFEGKT